MILINSRSGNKLAQYHIVGTVLSYIKLNYFYNVSRYKLTFTVVYYIIHRAGLSRKLVKIGGSSEPLEPPLVTGLLSASKILILMKVII